MSWPNSKFQLLKKMQSRILYGGATIPPKDAIFVRGTGKLRMLFAGIGFPYGAIVVNHVIWTDKYIEIVFRCIYIVIQFSAFGFGLFMLLKGPKIGVYFTPEQVISVGPYRTESTSRSNCADVRWVQPQVSPISQAKQAAIILKDGGMLYCPVDLVRGNPLVNPKLAEAHFEEIKRNLTVE